jgi:hypothetical protein
MSYSPLSVAARSGFDKDSLSCYSYASSLIYFSFRFFPVDVKVLTKYESCNTVIEVAFVFTGFSSKIIIEAES